MKNKKHRYSKEEIAQACLDNRNTPDLFPFPLRIPDFSSFVKETDIASNPYKLRERFAQWEIEEIEIQGVARLSDKAYGHRIINPIYVWPSLVKARYVSGDLFDYCNAILGNSTAKQLRPFTSEEFLSKFHIGQEVVITDALVPNKYDKVLIIGTRHYSNTHEIEFVTFGREDFSLSELKETVQYLEDGQWKPFGVFETEE